ncbi:hypothetical protein [Lutibacter sp.]|uniref:hypothetical protein n=1 Tax=Lutibacter sp. TaxID=1925666 RepID=UPI0025C24FB6|nr:hypothetical protein [Lutibacter sp.]MCF6180522.1 hypothetical protein [Lutibacter sp.]
MKIIKITFWVVCVLFVSNINAQEVKKIEKEKEPKHEISLELFELVTINKLEISYSYLLNNSNSIGLTLAHTNKGESIFGVDNFHDNFSVNMNYKHFFSEKHTQGFYIEFFGRYSNGDAFVYNNHVYQYSVEQNSLYLGAGVGYKFVTKCNFFINVNVGLAKKVYSFNKNIPYSKPNIFVQTGISIGKRF